MPRVPGIRRLLRIPWTRAGIARAVDDELQFHFDMTMRDLMANGLTPDEARKEVERRFGDVERTRERLSTIDRALAGHERRAEWWRAFAQDVRYALRGFRLKPGFAIAVIVTLALGIGANATMFDIVDRLLFRPPSFLVAPDRVGRVNFVRSPTTTVTVTGFRRFTDLRGSTRSFDAMTPFYARNMAVGVGEDAREMPVALSGADLWKMFDVTPVIGRFFTASEDTPPAGTPVAVLSYAFWQTRFGGRRDALGETVDIGAKKYTVVGVAPDGFTGFTSAPFAAFLPMSAQMSAESASNDWVTTYGMQWLSVFARRNADVSVERATADLTNAYSRSYLAELEVRPRAREADAKPRAYLGSVLQHGGSNQRNESRVALWLAGVAGMVLVIACANVANLLLARALRRRREIAVRIALGVSRSRLLTQLITESLLLAAFGGLAGLAVSQWGGRLIRKAILQEQVVAGELTNARVVLCVAVLASIAGLLTGLAPVLHAGRTDVAASLKAGSREGTVQRSRLRVALLVVQATLSVVLLIGAGLFVRSLHNVQTIRLGYDAERVAYVELNQRGLRFDTAQQVAIRQALLERAKNLPGVENASRALTVPFWSTWELDLFVAGIDSVNGLGAFTLQAGSPGLFATLGTKILRGRGITDDDRVNAPKVVVVSDGMARRLWPNEDAIGKCIRVNADTTPCRTVVGIAEDVRRSSLSAPEFHYYLPMEQFGRRQGGIFVRTRGSAESQKEQLRRSLQQVMPGVSYVTITPMSTILGNQTRSWRLGATMFTAFGALALVLAAIGLYSVIAYNVVQRTHEMGVRVALGAQGRDVIQLIIREGLTIVVPGVALGTIVALVAGKWVKPLLFEVSAKDPSVISVVVVTLIAVAITASWVPARRAARVDPNEALRAD